MHVTCMCLSSKRYINHSCYLNFFQNSPLLKFYILQILTYMAIRNLYRKIKVVSNVDTTSENNKNNNDEYGNNLKSISKRQICRILLSLVMVMALTVSLHMIQIVSVRSLAHMALAKPSWFPEPLKLDTNFICESLFVGVCIWQLAWTEIGFRPMPMTLVALYLSFMALSLAWDPIVFGLGAIKIGLLVSLARFGFVFGISKMLVWPLDRMVLIGCGVCTFYVFSLNIKLLSL